MFTRTPSSRGISRGIVPAGGSAAFPAVLFAALLAGTLLSACGGGSGGGAAPRVAPVAPSVPQVASEFTAANRAAIDPTLAFRTVRLPPAASGFNVTRTAPNHPVPVIRRIDYPGTDPGQIPADLDAMTARAALLWTRRLIDGGIHAIELRVGDTGECAASDYACARTGRIVLPGRFLEDAIDDQRPGNRLENWHFGILLHEVGHTLSYLDPQTGTGHAACQGTQLMCPASSFRSLVPAEADFAGLHRWTLGPAVEDHQKFGLWAEPMEDGGLDGFGVTMTRTLISERRGTAAADSITDTIAITPGVAGTPGPGPDPGLGTATWSGTFLGAQSALFQPVTGRATLTADLADLAEIDLMLSDLSRTDSAGATHPIAAVGYDLVRHDGAWVDAGRRANARFYATAGDPAGAAAGIVNDAGRDLVGAWGARR